MRLGIFAKTFPGTAPRPVLEAVRKAGFASAHYNFACSGLPSLPEAVPHGVADAVMAASRDTGVAIAGVSATYNMIHPDPARRAAGLRGLKAVIAAAPLIGAPLVTLCTGTRHAEDMWHGHPANAGAEAWRDLTAEMEKACALAEAAGVRLGIEPEPGNVISSAEKAQKLLAEMRSESLAIVLDPANLVEGAAPEAWRGIVARAAALLGERIAVAHAKDRDGKGAVVAAGRGLVDFAHAVASLCKAGFRGDVIAHGLSPEEAPGAARHLAERLRA
jgi:sugar phosphate isomerase/epimerase